MNLSKAERTAAITRSIANGRRVPLASFDSRKYIQYNLHIGDGLEPILAFMDGLPPKQTRADVVRAFEDGDNPDFVIVPGMTASISKVRFQLRK